MDKGAWRATVHRDSPGKNTGVGCHALLQQDLPDPGIEPFSFMSPTLAGEFFLPLVPPGSLLNHI